MARISFTRNLERHIEAPCVEATGSTVRQALDQVFAGNPALQGYILDEQGRLRKHVAVFVNGDMVQDRVHLTDPVSAADEVFVMQALSGG